MTINEMTGVMLAKESGKNIQIRNFGSNKISDWELVIDPSWDWEQFEYRIFIESVEASYYEYFIDNVWEMTTRRYATYEFEQIANDNEYLDYAVISELGTKTVEDTRIKD